jgi:hypothetical protein
MAEARIKGGISFDSRSVEQGVNRSIGHARRFENAMAASRQRLSRLGIGGIGFAGIALGANKAIKSMSELTDEADQLDLSTDQLQAYDAALRRMGGSANDMRTALRNVGNAQDELAGAPFMDQASTKMAQFADAIGMSVSEFAKLSNLEALDKIGEALAGENLTAIDIARDILGARSSRKVAPALQAIAEAGGIEAFTETARAEIIPADKLQEADKAADDLAIKMREAAVSMASLVPIITRVMSLLENALNNFNALYKAISQSPLFGGLSPRAQEIFARESGMEQVIGGGDAITRAQGGEMLGQTLEAFRSNNRVFAATADMMRQDMIKSGRLKEGEPLPIAVLESIAKHTGGTEQAVKNLPPPGTF